MKKFKFSLETVLSYKQQILDVVKNEHAALVAQVRAQEEVLEAAWQKYRNYNEEFRERKLEGLSVIDAIRYENGLRVLESDIARETKTLEELQCKAEKKREEMVDAKIDTASLEKLREKKLNSYQKAMQKKEEDSIEEFISAMRASS